MAEQGTKTMWDRLADPFPQSEIEFKPAMVKGNRALALCYLTARAVEDRLDEVITPGAWRDEYEERADGAVLCRLWLKVDGEWLKKEDVGGESEQPDGGDRRKAAYSDALKRAAVKWGIGRYLYFLPQLWCDYDPAKKQLTEPAMPAWALPGGSGRPHKPNPPKSPAERVAAVKETIPGVKTGAELPPPDKKNDAPKGPTRADQEKERNRLVGLFTAAQDKTAFDAANAATLAAIDNHLLTEADRTAVRSAATAANGRISPTGKKQPAGEK